MQSRLNLFVASIIKKFGSAFAIHSTKTLVMLTDRLLQVETWDEFFAIIN